MQGGKNRIRVLSSQGNERTQGEPAFRPLVASSFPPYQRAVPFQSPGPVCINPDAPAAGVLFADLYSKLCVHLNRLEKAFS